MRLRTLSYLSTLLAVTACGPKTEAGLTVLAPQSLEAVLTASLEYVGGERRVTVVADPAAELARRGGFVIAVVPRDDCTECYRLEGTGQQLTVHGGVPLGVQYGLAHAMELFGYRFFHPWRGVASLKEAVSVPADEFAPEVDLRRGLHLHTLHPIEPYYDFWESGEANLEGARRTIDFIVKNRGNYVQWCALDDILNRGADNHAHLKAIVDSAHSRGVKTGVAIQLFGKSNLQNAFDLIDDDPDVGGEMRRRLHLLLDGTGFDHVSLSFGEFFGADPALFIQRIDEAYAAIHEVAPDATVSGTIHLGDQPSLKVTYMGETLLYYFLVKYARPELTPWIHTVMFYDLYENAGGAYFHQDFRDHRAFIEGRLAAGTPVGYHPESAYWVAFDNSVPLYLPLYMRSRWVDLKGLAAAGRLRDHVLFSTGWEWGYWQTDAATLRMTYRLPESWAGPVRDFFAADVADLIERFGEAQHDGLMVKRLAPYLAGRDQLIDAGRQLGIVSQPDRVLFEDIAATPDFRARVLEPLKAFADALTALDSERAWPVDDPFLAELADGFEITARRARFAFDVNKAAADLDAAAITSAEAELAAAKAITSRRRKGMHDPDVKPILRATPNATFYQYGYLREADTLCFWERELAQVRRLVLHTQDVVPGCVL